MKGIVQRMYVCMIVKNCSKNVCIEGLLNFKIVKHMLKEVNYISKTYGDKNMHRSSDIQIITNIRRVHSDLF